MSTAVNKVLQDEHSRNDTESEGPKTFLLSPLRKREPVAGAQRPIVAMHIVCMFRALHANTATKVKLLQLPCLGCTCCATLPMVMWHNIMKNF